MNQLITSKHALAEKCNYGTLHDELLRDRLVFGLRDSTLSEQMQLDRELTLEKAINEKGMIVRSKQKLLWRPLH